MPTMRFPSTGRSQTVEGTAESRSPKYGHIQNPPYCIQNHAENCFAPSSNRIQKQSTARGNRFPPNHTHNALAQVLAGFRINQWHGGIAFPQVLAVLGPTGKVFSSSTGAQLRTIQTNHGSRRAAVRGWPFPGCWLAEGAARKYGVCQGGVNLEDLTQRLAPFGNHAGCRTAQNGKLEDSGPSVPERTFQLSGFDHSG